MIVVNGKEYRDFSEIPDEYKVIFKDENKNGIPDMLEGILGSFDPKNHKNIDAQFSTLFYKGKTYKDSRELPPEAREILEKGLSGLDKTGLKIAPGVYNYTQLSAGTGTVDSADKVPQGLRNEASDLNPNFKFRLIMTAIFFVLAVVYILWLLKML